MRRNRDQCPNCSADVGPNYQFCLACGTELNLSDLPDPEPEPTPQAAPAPVKKQKRKDKRLKVTPVPGVPYSYAEAAAAYEVSQSESRKKRSSGRLRLVLMLAILVGGAVGAMMYWNEHPSSASGRISWTAVTEFDFANIWIDNTDEAMAALRKNIPAAAIEAQANGVADDGMVSLQVDGKNVVVRLAGVPETFAAQCLGDKAISRLNRVLPSGAVVFVMVDGEGRLGVNNAEAPPAVYLWMVDPDAGRVRYANQELISSGEAEFAEVTLSTGEVGEDLRRASARAQEKQRGRYKAGSCI
jgi:hypothetical protein